MSARLCRGVDPRPWAHATNCWHGSTSLLGCSGRGLQSRRAVARERLGKTFQESGVKSTGRCFLHNILCGSGDHIFSKNSDKNNDTNNNDTYNKKTYSSTTINANAIVITTITLLMIIILMIIIIMLCV